MGCICFPVPVLNSIEGKHQFSINHLQAGGRVDLRFHQKIWGGGGGGGGGSSKKLIRTVWMRSSRISEEALGRPPPFFHSLSLDPPATMEELYRQADKYSTLEDNIWTASQTVMITAQSSKPATKDQSEQKGSQSKNQKRSRD